MKPLIISNETEIFTDRNEAGIRLGYELQKRIDEKPLVLGIPRGGMATANGMRSVLDCDIDVILTHKIRAPFDPELAIGAINEDGKTFLNDYLILATQAEPAYIRNEKREQLETLIRRKKLFRLIYPKISLKNRVVVITDDGIATGATAQAALWAAREEKPAKLIGAFPVASSSALKKLSYDADAVICLQAPDTFHSISQFYYNFSQISDEEILNILRRENERKKIKERTYVHY